MAVARAIDGLCGTSARIKWVNDVFLGGKKVCGILTEGAANFETGRIEAANVGIGINVHPMGFTGELADIAGSIDEALAATRNAAKSPATPRVTRNDVVAHTVAHLLRLYDAMEAGDAATAGDALEEYRRRSLVIGRLVTVRPAAGLSGEPYQAQVLGIDDNAALIVQTAGGGRKTLQSGEVSLHGTKIFH